MPAYIPLGLKNNGLFPRLSGLWCPRPMITLSICPWTTKAVCKQARPPAWRGLLHLPASVCRYGEVQTELSSELCSDKQGRRPWGHRQLQKRLIAALQIGCHLLLAFFGRGANVIQEELYCNIHLPKQTKKPSVLILL